MNIKGLILAPQWQIKNPKDRRREVTKNNVKGRKEIYLQTNMIGGFFSVKKGRGGWSGGRSKPLSVKY